MFISKRKLIVVAMSSCLLLTANVQAQKNKNVPKTVTDTAKVKADTARKTPPPGIVIKPYKEVITPGTATRKGFLTVHQKDDKYYFEVPNEILGRDILIVGRVSKAAAEMRNGFWGYTGDQIGETVYRFERGVNKKLFLRRVYFREYSGDSTKPMFASVQNNNVMAIAQAFPIAAYTPDSNGVVIDVTEFLNSDNDILYFENKKVKDRAGMGGQMNDRSYIESVLPYKENLEVRAVKTYGTGLNPMASSYTLELNASLILLPEKPMKRRMQDNRVGYFIVGHRDFDTDPQGVEDAIFVKRWRLEPKPGEETRYLRGELVEPAKPIVFYIDPATPKQWIPYLIQGVNDWQKAFEQAGFKNAIVGREAPTLQEDSTWSLHDARHSAIIYRASNIPNAMGPSVSDPRSGEILESHIFWYHNVMSLLRNWYFAQCGATDPNALQRVLPDSLMGKLIRFVSSHEVGHTLGLMHNFGSSSTVPVEKLRDKAWLEKHGHTPSIMDYARFNYVAQPEDHVGEAGLFPRINDYDKWAIEWAYRWFPASRSEEEEQQTLAKTVTDSLKKNHRLWFGGEMNFMDARCQSEAVGDNAMKAGDYGIKNLKRILPTILKWAPLPYEDFSRPMNYLQAVFQQYSIYIGHVLNNIGSIEKTDKVAAEPGAVYTPTVYATQKEAMQWLNRNVFETPSWLNNKELLDKYTVNFISEVATLQSEVLNALLVRNRMSRMMWTEQTAAANQKTYTLTEMLNDLNRNIFKEVYEGKKVDMYRRNLQKSYVNRLVQQVFTPGVNSESNISDIVMPWGYHFLRSDIPLLLKDNLRTLEALCKKGMANPGIDKMTRLHLEDMYTTISAKFAAEKRG